MRYAFIEEHRSGHGVEKMCLVLEVTRSGYYAWRKRPLSNRRREDERLLQAVKQVYRQNKGNYGARG